ncbi:dehydrogenase [Prevotella sp. HMSC073D09]|nr:dehydrogenase [Prevotella sp. HMSC073D09]
MADNYIENKNQAYEERKKKWLKSQQRYPVNLSGNRKKT